MGEKNGGAKMDNLDMLCEPVGEEEGMGMEELLLEVEPMLLKEVGEVLLPAICCSLADRIEAERVRMELEGTEDVEAMLTDELRRLSGGVEWDDELPRCPRDL